MSLQVLINAATAAASFALMGAGFTLIYATTGVFDLAFGAVATIACYVFLYAIQSLGLPLWAAILTSAVAAFLLGALIEGTLYNSLYRRRALPKFFFLGSLGAFTLLQGVVGLLFGNQTRLPIPGPSTPIAIGPIKLTIAQCLLFTVATMAIIILNIIDKYTDIGRSLRAVRDNAKLASTFGLSVTRTRVIAVALGTTLGALPLIINSIDIGVSPTRSLPHVLTAATVMLVAGGKSIYRAQATGIFLGFVVTIAAWIVPARWTPLITFSMLLLVLTLRKPEA